MQEGPGLDCKGGPRKMTPTDESFAIRVNSVDVYLSLLIITHYYRSVKHCHI